MATIPRSGPFKRCGHPIGVARLQHGHRIGRPIFLVGVRFGPPIRPGVAPRRSKARNCAPRQPDRAAAARQCAAKPRPTGETIHPIDKIQSAPAPPTVAPHKPDSGGAADGPLQRSTPWQRVFAGCSPTLRTGSQQMKANRDEPWRPRPMAQVADHSLIDQRVSVVASGRTSRLAKSLPALRLAKPRSQPARTAHLRSLVSSSTSRKRTWL